MKRSFTLIVAILAFVSFSHAQALETESTYEFPTLKKDTYLGEVTYNPVDHSFSLVYVERDVFITRFITYNFDAALNFIGAEQDEYTLGDAGREMMETIRGKYRWFNYRGDSYTLERVYITPSFGGKIIARKYQYTYTYNWTFGVYFGRAQNMGTVKIKGAEDQKIYLYDRFDNSESGEVYLLVGVKGDKYQHARKFQIVRITPEMEAEYLEEIDFATNQCINFTSVITNIEPDEVEGVELAPDLATGDAVIIFSPIKGLLAKKFQDDNPGKQTLVMIGSDGAIKSKVEYQAATSGWVVEGYVQSVDMNDIYFYGPAKDDAYINKLMPVNSPLAGQDEIKDIKWKNFQIMKVSGGELSWIESTPLEDFKDKSVNPPSQKKSPYYTGKKFAKSLAYVTPGGEMIICGQKFTTKQVPDPNASTPGATRKVVDKYKDLIMFHFDNHGKLKAQYGVRRDENNKWSKSMLTPQYVYVSPDNKSLYWIYGELAGFRRGLAITGGVLELAGAGNIRKEKLLFYPACAKVDLASGDISDFVAFGADEDGKQRYYTNPNFPQLVTDDGQLVFIGEDKKGKVVWLGKLKM